MNDFKKRPFNRDSRPSTFARPSHSRGGNSRPSFGAARQTELFKATCSKCNKGCDVPFKPNGKKPVFCKDCFVRDDSQGESSYGANNNSRSTYSTDRDRHAPERSYAKPVDDGRITAMQKELATINAKLDVIIQTVGSAAYTAILKNSGARTEDPIKEKPKTKKVSKAPAAAPVKKAAKKK